MKRTKKQTEFYEALKSGKYLVFFLAGGVGSGKTIPALNFIHGLCKTIPGIRIPIYRKSEKVLKNNTIPSYRKVLEMNKDVVHIVDMKAKYPNGSEILFLWADITKDPDCDNAKGGEWTGALFDEINQIDQKYYNITKTRVGRWNEIKINGKIIKIKPFIIGTCNPTNNWVKTEFYDKNEAGTLNKNIFFQLSLPTDNPFLSKDYLESLEDLPEEEYNRYVLGDWNYNDDTNALIKYEWIKNCITDREYEYSRDILESLGIDVARYGDDRTVFCQVQEKFFYGFKEFRKQDIVETAERAVIELQERTIQDRIAVDSIGLGAGVVDILINKNIPAREFNSSNAPEGQLPFYTFRNLRAEVLWRIRESIKNEEIEICNNPELIKELTNIKYFIKDKVIQIESKDEFKKRMGFSPDYSDSMMIAYWVTFMAEQSFEIDDEIGQTITGNIMNQKF